MKKLFTLFAFFFLFSSIISAQNKFMIYADYSLFRFSENKSTLELYFSVNQRDLTYAFDKNEYTGQANIEVNIFSKSKNKSVFDDLFGLQAKVTDSTKNKITNKLIGQQNFNLPVDEYVVNLIGSDYNNKSRIDTVKFEISITPYESEKTYISQIQLSSACVRSNDKNSIFYKNGFEITPNPDVLFGMNLKSINYYLEIYSISKEFFGENNYLMFYITDISNNVIKQTFKPEKSKSTAFIETGSMDIDSLESGSYFFKARLIDSATGSFIEKEKKFFVFNKSKIANDGRDEKSFLISEYKTMSLEKIEDEYNKSIYIRDKRETDEFKKLSSLDDKRKYMFEFWGKRKTNPNSPVNDFKVEYFKRILEANKQFKEGFKDGWRTDKGRIFIMYGTPDEVENHPNEANSKGYEIWTYNNIQGKAVCVFAEYEIGGGNYRLIHSTIRGELRDDDWKKKVLMIDEKTNIENQK